MVKKITPAEAETLAAQLVEKMLTMAKAEGTAPTTLEIHPDADPTGEFALFLAALQRQFAKRVKN